MNKIPNKSDPLGILPSVKYVTEKSRHVRINTERILDASLEIKRYHVNRGFETSEQSFGKTGDLANDTQLVFIEDVVNFCFWPDRGQPKWRVEFPKGKVVDGGWYALKTCFERAMAEGVPVLRADYLENIKAGDAARIFRGVGGVNMPMLHERIQNLREAGRVLLKHFDGKFINALEVSKYDAVELVKLIIKSFASFKDEASYKRKKVYIYKRAQICAFDISYVLKEYGKPQLRRLDELTAFADYKLPQILRMLGVLEYDQKLARKVDNQTKIPAGSPEEVEIRTATIWAVELIARELPDLTPAQIDNIIWLISQDKKLQAKIKPYHRTRTIYY